MALQDLVVLRVPLVRVWRLFQPLLILRNCEEVDALLALCYLCESVRECTSQESLIQLTRTIGVTNSTRKFGIFNRDGKKWSKKLMRRPLMCEPSWSYAYKW